MEEYDIFYQTVSRSYTNKENNSDANEPYYNWGQHYITLFIYELLKRDCEFISKLNAVDFKPWRDDRIHHWCWN